LGRKFKPLDIRVIQQNRLGTAVSRIAAIQPNVLALTNMNGPLRTLVMTAAKVSFEPKLTDAAACAFWQ
jgi:hypothetical protein